MWRLQNYNVFKEISKVSTSWQVEKTAGLIMSQKWLSLKACIYFDNKGLKKCFFDVKQRATKRKQKA